jgi:hypothetical protein
MVAGYNGNGEPDIWFVKVQVPDDYESDEDGKHYPAAKQAAENNGYEGPFVAFDEIDHAGNAMLGLFAWETASIVDLDGNEIE